jgi:hypothetical protein
MNELALLRRFRISLSFLVAGLVVSGITAFPLESELAAIVSVAPASDSGVVHWLRTVYAALKATNNSYPFLAYGTDWLAFAHLVIAVAFIGPWLQPVRNQSLITFGLIACVGVIPLALIAGPIRGIPLAWRCIDVSFGVFGMIPLLVCRRCVLRLEKLEPIRSLAPRGRC